MTFEEEVQDFIDNLDSKSFEETMEMTTKLISEKAKEHPLGNVRLTEVAITSNMLFEMHTAKLDDLQHQVTAMALLLETVTRMVAKMSGAKVPDGPKGNVH